MQTVRLAQRNNYKCVMSHRSGESEDAFIADFAVALNTGEIKTVPLQEVRELQNTIAYSKSIKSLSLVST